jgi:membrane associated rhomboid family serine protease
MMARVPSASSSFKSPANAGTAGIMTIILYFSPFRAARTMRSTMAAPILFLIGFCWSPVAVMKN